MTIPRSKKEQRVRCARKNEYFSFCQKTRGMLRALAGVPHFAFVDCIVGNVRDEPLSR